MVGEGPVTDVITGVLIWTMLVAILAAIAIGILRYRLFDIELVINRTLVYGTLTVCIVVAYVAIVGALNALINQRGVAGVLAAGLVAAGVQPLRLRLQRRADRWVYGDRSDPYAALTRLGERLQDTLAPSQVVQTVVDSVAEALRLRHAAVEFERDGSVEVVAAHGKEGGGELRRVPLIYNGEQPRQPRRPGPAGPAAERSRRAPARGPRPARRAGGPRSASQRRPAALARAPGHARARRSAAGCGATSTTGWDPRWRGWRCSWTRPKSKASDPEIETVLGELRTETQDAIADIRRVVYELRPPALDELGLVGALREQAARLSAGGDGLSVTVEAPDLPPLPAAVEVAAYRIATEALTNVSRHAGAHRCLVELTLAGATGRRGRRRRSRHRLAERRCRADLDAGARGRARRGAGHPGAPGRRHPDPCGATHRRAVTTPISVIVADDHPVFRQGLRALLEGVPDIELIGEAADGRGRSRWRSSASRPWC